MPTDVEIWGVTGTVDYLLTDQLKIRGEVRWDTISKDSGIRDGEFFRGHIENDVNDGHGLSNDQVTIGAEVIYSFTKFGGE